VEEHFYLIWPFIFKYFRKYRNAFAWLIILSVPVIRIIYVKYPIDLINRLTIFQKGDALMWGCVFAIYKDRISQWLKNIQFIFLFILAAFLFLDHSPRMHLNPTVYLLTVPSLCTTTGTIGDIMVGALILSSISRGNAIWYKFLNIGWMNYIGKLSYSLYIWQQLFFSASIGILGKFPLNIVLIFIVANLSYYFIEKPFLLLKTKFEKKPLLKRNTGQDVYKKEPLRGIVSTVYDK